MREGRRKTEGPKGSRMPHTIHATKFRRRTRNCTDVANKRADLNRIWYCFERMADRAAFAGAPFPTTSIKAIEAINSAVIRKEWQWRLWKYDIFMEPAESWNRRKITTETNAFQEL